ncbi:hypothetical protein Bphy_7007 (plasmid) [Paraburkholderia phymatum STM815]|uniref:Uncharacterized protein n=1 Tax=Paraburkholderia phymatum (strain DSM 17167 / CIP 108236 / LMG 21445 / STM815) TaxID=391038 RepID=B2JTW0_PARP8|nr:hypothetical protein Bphy_7007 [Paraburkholderia phymatum STM815]
MITVGNGRIERPQNVHRRSAASHCDYAAFAARIDPQCHLCPPFPCRTPAPRMCRRLQVSDCTRRPDRVDRQSVQYAITAEALEDHLDARSLREEDLYRRVPCAWSWHRGCHPARAERCSVNPVALHSGYFLFCSCCRNLPNLKWPPDWRCGGAGPAGCNCTTHC